jgi:hypothetical protein
MLVHEAVAIRCGRALQYAGRAGPLWGPPHALLWGPPVADVTRPLFCILHLFVFWGWRPWRAADSLHSSCELSVWCAMKNRHMRITLRVSQKEAMHFLAQDMVPL